MSKKHPYKTFKIIPDIPSEFVERPLEEIRASIKKNLKKVSVRNKTMIPPYIYIYTRNSNKIMQGVRNKFLILPRINTIIKP